jgi:hypothetical protein
MVGQVNPSPRKCRLFAVACCRQVIHLVNERTVLKALECAERYADGETLEAVFSVWSEAAIQVFLRIREQDFGTQSIVMRGAYLRVETYAVQAIRDCMSEDAKSAAQEVPDSVAAALSGAHYEGDPPFDAAQAMNASLLRCIVGNPFRPVSLDPRWLTSTVVDLARSIYEADPRQAGGYMNLPILADALMDAGCDNEDLLNHCRSSGPHVRGCWAIDLILGKS